MHIPIAPPILDDNTKPIYDLIRHAIDSADVDKAVELVRMVSDRDNYATILSHIVSDLASNLTFASSLSAPIACTRALTHVHRIAQEIEAHDFVRAHARARVLARAFDFLSTASHLEQDITTQLAQATIINNVVLRVIPELSKEQFLRQCTATEVSIKKAEAMDLGAVTDKDLHELERLSKELLVVMRRAHLMDTIFAELLGEVEQQAANLRRARFDTADSEYKSY